ncbi:putative colanic acid biosynthesis acetyltransferase WcaF [Cellulosimicrobium aquatile]|jgi:putative colanic acid biosynthesis acetyltransferase WcaF|uniref:Putative colanic acid biosynthesis acetyltransferase WcaF n=1 Tax=Cellulosimicrobium aquatile TaxID=1612203 RepID=A0A1N6RY91_9MICO|nr:putative colanic acid biosynthesis acetyltransferase [Cellulosimicrobium aquatile]NMF28579.1 putative colanic acid biosynthesis acetyltransferase [Cellulosimicrobium aquatile]SIQ33739.1 putative colanic acid biosynthesis acetyltransferase WcaF [Cellulosimicrobium aquatile]
MTAQEERDGIRVVPLSEAPGEKTSWGRPGALVYLWGAAELLFVSNPWQISSRLRVAVLRAFGAHIGEGVVFRPRTRVRFPWKIHVGANCWIGEGVWIHNQDDVWIGHDAVLSQDTLVTTGSHRHRTDMGLVTAPVHVGPGAWVTARCVVLGGTRIGRSALVTPGSVVRGEVPDGGVWDGRSLSDRTRF